MAAQEETDLFYPWHVLVDHTVYGGQVPLHVVTPQVGGQGLYIVRTTLIPSMGSVWYKNNSFQLHLLRAILFDSLYCLPIHGYYYELNGIAASGYGSIINFTSK